MKTKCRKIREKISFRMFFLKFDREALRRA